MKNSRQTYFHIYIKTDEMMIIYFDEPNEVADELFEWYAEKGVTDFGEEVDVYNENKEYIGEEPAGRYELQQLAASFAERLHREGKIFRLLFMGLNAPGATWSHRKSQSRRSGSSIF